MWRRGPFCASCCFLWLIAVGIGLCQDQEIDVRAKRYYTLLSKRPGSAQLFDRFYDAWLDSSTLEALERYLNGQLANNPNVTHHLVLASFFERQGKQVESLRLGLRNPEWFMISWPHSWRHQARQRSPLLRFDSIPAA